MKLLIANRGEIACRIARTCKKLGIPSLALYSAVDAEALHARTADIAVPLGEESGYLDINRIVEIAEEYHCNLIHPGYGFLSENASFAEKVTQRGITFIGPLPSVISLMGDKVRAREFAQSLQVPVVPGATVSLSQLADASKQASAIGFPLIIKAANGGGGRGMRLVQEPSLLSDALLSASREAQAFFGSGEVFLERYIHPARHIEVQALGDLHGNILLFGDRDCSVQRSHQKIIEESPAPNLRPEIRAQLHQYARTLFQEARYHGAGTAEFLVGPKEEIFFLEINSRLQVEHPVTESVWEVDLVELQIQAALGQDLSVLASKTTAISNSYAIEVRVCAEIPERKFLPSTGKITQFHLTGDRIDTGFEAGDRISSSYDSLLAKIITKGNSREEAVAKMSAALSQCEITGVTTNIGFLHKLIQSNEFRRGEYSLDLIPRYLPSEEEVRNAYAYAAFLSSIERLKRQADCSPWNTYRGWTLSGSQSARYRYQVEDHLFEVDIQPISTSVFSGVVTDLLSPHSYSFSSDGLDGRRLNDTWVRTTQGIFEILPQLYHPITRAKKSKQKEQPIIAPLPGKVLSISILIGQQICPGDLLLTLESMKMEHPITALTKGSVQSIEVTEGQLVEKGFLLVKVRHE